MEKNRKEEILKTAQKLFHEKGYNHVSLRDIADALHISVGNLTYHYNKKEQLIEAIKIKQHPHYAEKPIPTTIYEFYEFLKEVIHNHSEDAYYFRDYGQLAQICPKVYEIQVKVIKDMYCFLQKTVENLEKTGDFLDTLTPQQKEGVIHSIMLFLVYGMPHFERIKPSENIEQVMLSDLYGILSLCLSEKGKKVFLKGDL